MRTSEQVDKIAAALLAFQKEVEPPTKTKENPYYKSMYADLCSLFAHCKPLMQKNGLVFTSVGLTSRLMHSSGQWIEGDFTCEMHGLSAQQVGSAMTYGRRYNFQGLLGINAEDDDDGEGTKPKAAQQQEPKKYPLKPVSNVKPQVPQQTDEDRVPPEVTDGEAEKDPLELRTLQAFSKEKTDSKNNKYRGLLLGDDDWWNCYDVETLSKVSSLKGKRVYAKLELKGTFKLCHNLTEAANG